MPENKGKKKFTFRIGFTADITVEDSSSGHNWTAIREAAMQFIPVEARSIEIKTILTTTMPNTEAPALEIYKSPEVSVEAVDNQSIEQDIPF